MRVEKPEMYEANIYWKNELIGTYKHNNLVFMGYHLPFRSFPRDWVLVKHIKAWLKEKEAICKMLSVVDKKKLTFEKTHNRKTGNVYYEGELFLKIASGTGSCRECYICNCNGEFIKPLKNTRKTTLRSFTMDMIDKSVVFLDEIERLFDNDIDAIQ